MSTVAELDQVLDRIDAHDTAAWIDVMIPQRGKLPGVNCVPVSIT